MLPFSLGTIQAHLQPEQIPENNPEIQLKVSLNALVIIVADCQFKLQLLFFLQVTCFAMFFYYVTLLLRSVI